MKRAAWTIGLWLVAVAHARAEPLPLELEWQAPPECASAEQVRAELARTARVRPGMRLTPLSARGEVARRGGAYAVTLVTEHDGRRGERKLEAGDCATLVRSVILVLALAFGSGVEVSEAPAAEVAKSGPESESGPEPTSATDSESDADSESETESESEPEPDADVESEARGGDRSWTSELSLGLWLGAGAQLALLPATALSANAGIELGWPAFALGLRAWLLPAGDKDLRADLDARFRAIGGAVQLCRPFALPPFAAGLCGAFRAAALHGRSDGLPDEGSATAPWFALAAGATLTWPDTGSIRVRAEAGLAASLNRPRFEIENLGPVHRVPLLVPDLGLVLSFWP